MQIAHTIRKHLPRRRKRFWRYVSARRHGVGIVVCLTLMALIYGHWALTNDERILAQATGYLRRLLGTHVTIDDARFSLFGPIELRGVRVFTPEGDRPGEAISPYPLLRTHRVILRHQPWALLFHLRVKPAEITFVEPEIIIEHYSSEGGKPPRYSYNFQKLFRGRKLGTDLSPDTPMDLPHIRVDQCRLIPVEVMGPSRVVMKETRWHIVMKPQPPANYVISIEPVRDKAELAAVRKAYETAVDRVRQMDVSEPEIAAFLASVKEDRARHMANLSGGDSALAAALAELERTQEALHKGHVSFELNVPTGTLRPRGSVASIQVLADVLPSKYRKWRQRFEVQGRLRILEKDRPGDTESLDIELVNVSLKMPDEQGGLHLRSVRGLLKFADNGLTLENVRGQIVEAGGGRFVLSGRYGGFETTSPFELDVSVEDLAIPTSLPKTSALGRFADVLQRWYSPQGTMYVRARILRPKDGKISVAAIARPDRMSILHKYFRYRMYDVTGLIRFNTEQAVFENVTCRRDGGQATINGTVALMSGGKIYDVIIKAEDLLCSDALMKALPERWRKVWQTVNPGGRIGAEIHLQRTQDDERHHLAVDVTANGHASMAYRGFPYPVENMTGRIQFSREAVTIQQLYGRRGPMRCKITGAVTGINTPDRKVDITVRTLEGAPMPVDETLLAALAPGPAKAVRSLHPKGNLDVVFHATQTKGRELRYDVDATLSDGVIKPDVFPYEITDLTGRMQIVPGRMTLHKGFRGRHGKTPVELVKAGTVHLDAKKTAVALDIRTGPLDLDEDLYAAMPEAVQKIWKQFSPLGRATVVLSLRNNTPEHPDGLHYQVDMEARDVQATYQAFPHPLKHMRGHLIATPGMVVLKGLSAHASPEATEPLARISGVVTYDDRKTDVDLMLQADAVNLNKDILAAMPDSMSALRSQLRPGGKCRVDLQTLRVVVTDPAPATETRPARPKPITWSAKGKQTLRDAVLAIGGGNRAFSGSLSGSAGHDGKGLRLDANMNIDRLLIEKRKIHNIRAGLLKSAGGSLIRLKDFSAEAYGGRMAGFAEIKLTRPIQYGVSLSVEAVRLEDLVRVGTSRPDKVPDVVGLLAGNMQLTGTIGKLDTRRASGVMRISKAKILKLPVMLGLLQVVVLGLPGDSAFTDGNLNYHLTGNQLVFEEIYLSGPTLTIVGSGTMDLKSRSVKLRFLSGSQRKLPRLQFLDELLKGVFRELGEIHIDGPIDNPHIRTVPLRSLDKFLKELLRPGERKGG